MRKFESNQCLHLFFFIFIVSYFYMNPLRVVCNVREESELWIEDLLRSVTQLILFNVNPIV